MPTSLPIELLLAFVLVFGFVSSHQRHTARFNGSSPTFQMALMASTVIGVLVGLGLLVLYFVHVAWYWPLVLFVTGTVLGGILFGILDKTIGQLPLTLIGFVAWPISAVWAFLAIRSIPT
jgi:hypothetical protein